MSTAGAAGPAVSRLRLSRNPLRLAVSGGPWRSLWYLAGYVLVSGWLLFAAAFTAVATALAFSVTIAGLPLLAASAGVLRGCAGVERARLRPMFTEPVRGRYRKVSRRGLIGHAVTRWQDRQTWRDAAYLIGLWVPLAALDTVVITVWLALLCCIALPAWYWAPEGDFGHGIVAHGVQLGTFPNGPDGPGGHGIFIGTLPSAIAAAVVSLILFLAFNYVLVATARAHAAVARGILRPPADPLAAARDVLARPGPLAVPAPASPLSPPVPPGPEPRSPVTQ